MLPKINLRSITGQDPEFAEGGKFKDMALGPRYHLNKPI